MKKILFKDYPDTTTPIDADNLNLLQDNVEEDINNVTKYLVATAESNGDFKINISNVLEENMKLNIKFPLATTPSSTARLSIDGGNNYKNIRIDGTNIIAGQVQNKKYEIWYDGSYWRFKPGTYVTLYKYDDSSLNKGLTTGLRQGGTLNLGINIANKTIRCGMSLFNLLDLNYYETTMLDRITIGLIGLQGQHELPIASTILTTRLDMLNSTTIAYRGNIFSRITFPDGSSEAVDRNNKERGVFLIIELLIQ